MTMTDPVFYTKPWSCEDLGAGANGRVLPYECPEEMWRTAS